MDESLFRSRDAIASASEVSHDYVRAKRREAEQIIGTVEVWGRIAGYAEVIKTKYSNWREYQLFNVLIGSTIRAEKMPYLDFPDTDSVKNFVETLVATGSQ